MHNRVEEAGAKLSDAPTFYAPNVKTGGILEKFRLLRYLSNYESTNLVKSYFTLDCHVFTILSQKYQNFPGASPPGPLDGAGLALLGQGAPFTIFELPPCLMPN